MSQNQTKRIVFIAILSAISVLLMQFLQLPLWFTGDFMKIDLSIIPILIGLFILGLPSAMAILILRSVLKLLIFNEGVGTMIGLPMNIIAMGIFVIAIWFLLKNEEYFSMKRFILGGFLGTVLLTIAMAILNYVYAIPMYEVFANFSLSKIGMTLKDWIIGMVLPFNLIQGVLLTFVTSIVMIPLNKVVRVEKMKFL
ncbi:Riboflavin transporter FmnP [Pilibacter termitis]|uniref:Riboflavin transporter n=1 Tax=Pilibacter termitis TaxID=263852 RepID=A0A1T4KPI1_9ENTE|nr:ECF transporter S component [Pilibacter termitis]SJZ44330.1 Riboflavin transporter FmnP [Pilibacter termitis]